MRNIFDAEHQMKEYQEQELKDNARKLKIACICFVVAFIVIVVIANYYHLHLS